MFTLAGTQISAGNCEGIYHEEASQAGFAPRQQRMSERTYEAAYSESLRLDTVSEIAIARETHSLGRIPWPFAATGNYPAEGWRQHRLLQLSRDFLGALHRE